MDNQAKLRHVVSTARREKITCSSTFARTNATLIGMAASMQLITTRVGEMTYANQWLVTAKGLRWLNETE